VYRQETCITATCDDCHTDFDTEHDDYPGVIHFTDQANAERTLADAGWRAAAGGRLTCRRCAAEQDCAIYGHPWDSWQPCLCAGRVPDHHTTPGSTCTYQHRWCDRCLTGEVRPGGEDCG
jgi:hypothetical protein